MSRDSAKEPNYIQSGGRTVPANIYFKVDEL